MGHGYKAVQWYPFKARYDLALLGGVGVFLGAFAAGSIAATPLGQTMSEVQVAIRALGGGAFALLSLILMIGPLSRFSPRFLPLLYNRRHLGVTCFVLALLHAALVVVWYHGFSDVNPLISLLASNPRYDSIQGFPFESLGLLALVVLFLMAATSHDFWNANLGPRLWKGLHMAVYPAYGLVVVHILLGAVQGEKGVAYPVMVGAAAALVIGLHCAAGLRETRRDAVADVADVDGWLDAGDGFEIPDGRAVILTPAEGEKIAVFREGRAIHALSNVCRHQGGPLGEGRIIDGCVTCPWHGFQYQPGDGRSPPPFTEKVATYRTRLRGARVFVDPAPLAPGTPVAPSILPEVGAAQ
jgi:DMSO/TMAO reductase YedYZ heme-binding membrane subunit/nitrite reductase/ring-hydroxylating ferredoxin subunit